jgi:hypothetical protein
MFDRFRFPLNRGDHVCVFYHSEETAIETLVEFLLEGLQKNERCFCAQLPNTLKQVANGLRLHIDLEEEIARGALEFRDAVQVYAPNGSFHPQLLTNALIEGKKTALKQGFSNYRTTGDLSWAFQAGIEAQKIIEYEEMAERAISEIGSRALCQYFANAFLPKTNLALLEAHRLNLVDPTPPSACSWVQMRNKGFVAEIITDKAPVSPARPALYSYVVRHLDSDDVLQSGSARTFDAARSKAEQILKIVSTKN